MDASFFIIADADDSGIVTSLLAQNPLLMLITYGVLIYFVCRSAASENIFWGILMGIGFFVVNMQINDTAARLIYLCVIIYGVGYGAADNKKNKGDE